MAATIQVICASSARAEDYCASLSGSQWKDNAGNDILFVSNDKLIFIRTDDEYRYKCRRNTFTYETTNGHASAATISGDGRKAVFKAPDVGAVWELVAWPTDCSVEAQIVSNGNRITAYKRDFVSLGEKCASETRTCTNGVLSGNYLFLSCVVKPRTMAPETAAMLVGSVLIMGCLARRFLGRQS
jgi:hypothetical protein